MAQFDTSIYFQQQPIDVVGSIQKGLEAKKRLSELGKESERREKEDQHTDWKRKQEVADREAQLYRDSMYGVKDQQGYEVALGNLQKQGFSGIDQLPKFYDKPLVENTLAATMKYQDKRAAEMAAQEKEMAATQRRQDLAMKGYEIDAQGNPIVSKGGMADLQRKSLMAQTERTRADTAEKYAQSEKLRNQSQNPLAKLSEGEKALDKDFAKDYNDWTSGGQKIAMSEINKLRAVANDLRNENVTTGGLTGMFSDRITSNSVLKARADVQSTVMNSLKAILGAQFTEKEGERIIKNTWNEGDSTQNNLARIERLVSDLEGKAMDKTAKSQYFEQRGTLAGYKGGAGNMAPTPQAHPQDQAAVAWAKQNINDPRAQAILRANGISMQAGR